MMSVAIVKRRLKEGKTYEDFRKAWYHTTGFGTNNKMYSLINAFDEREIIVIGFTEIPTDKEEILKGLRIDVKERLDNPLDDVIEPDIDRDFGILISEDDFSAEGSIKYKNPTVNGIKTDVEEIVNGLIEFKQSLEQASSERDAARKTE
ncbi:ROK family protein [Methanobacterium sp.]|uniref:ROK family protein n=1 Tax=Methanobacterium sp. TaxID=2164 RepID=UPI0025F4539D|nr:ROK family protein [Methanobacterium sp.]MBI5458211.1 ROK family protein [Methanobacterium sp.]